MKPLGADDEPPWPLDTGTAVFIGRAIDRVGRAMFPAEWTGQEQVEREADEPLPERLLQACGAIVPLIERGELVVRARLVDTTGGELGVVHPTALTPEAWIEALVSHQIEFPDPRSRRRILQTWWLFASRNDLDRHLLSLGTVASAERDRTADALSTSTKQREKRKTGPKPTVMLRIIAAMQDDIRQRRVTPDELGSWTYGAMAAQYSCSDNTAKEARKRVFEMLKNSDEL